MAKNCGIRSEVTKSFQNGIFYFKMLKNSATLKNSTAHHKTSGP